MAAANSATVTGWGNSRRLPSGSVILTGMLHTLLSGDRYEGPRKLGLLKLTQRPGLTGVLQSGRREWDRTTDHTHVKGVLYH